MMKWMMRYALVLLVAFVILAPGQPCAANDSLDVEARIDVAAAGGHDFTLRYWFESFAGARRQHFWLVREKGVLTLYVSDDQRSYRKVGELPVTTRIGSLGRPGAMNDVRIANEAIHPNSSC